MLLDEINAMFQFSHNGVDTPTPRTPSRTTSSGTPTRGPEISHMRRSGTPQLVWLFFT